MKQLIAALALGALSVIPLGATEETEAPEAPRVEITTSKGVIVVELYPDKAPKSVDNFLGYVRQGFYEGTIFHRVMPNFMIQGGGFDAKLQLRPPAGTIANEADNGLKNERGTVAMARRNDPHSATSQFFINHVDNKGLDHRGKYDGATWGYTVFGKVVEGMDVVDAIAAVPTGGGPKGMRDVPLEPVSIDGAVWLNGPDEEETKVTLD